MSIRYDAQTALQAWLSTEVIPANGYTFDLSPLGVVTNDIQSPKQRAETMQDDASVQIEEADERVEMSEISPDTLRTSFFEIQLSCLIRGDATDDPPRMRMNQFIADVNKGVGKNPTLTGTVDRAWISFVSVPVYSPDGSLSEVGISLLVRYQYQAGFTI